MSVHITCADWRRYDPPGGRSQRSGDALFKQFDIQMGGGLDAIAGIPPSKSTRSRRRARPGRGAAELNPKDFGQEWSDAGATVGLTYYRRR